MPTRAGECQRGPGSANKGRRAQKMATPPPHQAKSPCESYAVSIDVCTYFCRVIWNQYWSEWWVLADSPPCLFIILLFHLHINYLFKLISIIRIHALRVPCNTTPVTCKYRCHTSKLFCQYGQDFSLYLTIFLLFLNLVFNLFSELFI